MAPVVEQTMGAGEGRGPVTKRYAAMVFVGLTVLGAVAWGASQGSRTFGHYRVEGTAGAVEWRGNVVAEIERNSLELTFPATPTPVHVTLPWPSEVAADVDAFVQVQGAASPGHAELEESGAYVSGRFDAVLEDGSRVTGGFRAQKPAVN